LTTQKPAGSSTLADLRKSKRKGQPKEEGAGILDSTAPIAK